MSGGEDRDAECAAGHTWMPGIWGYEQHICSNPTVTGYAWEPVPVCTRAVIVAYPPDDPALPWPQWPYCADCLEWARRVGRRAMS